MLPVPPLANGIHGVGVDAQALGNQVAALSRSQNFSHLVLGKDGTFLAFPVEPGASTNVVTVIFGARRPAKIGRHVVSPRSVKVGNVVVRGWSVAMKCGANKLVNVFGGPLASTTQPNHDVPTRRVGVGLSDAPSVGRLSPPAASATDPTLAADFIRPPLNGAPFFNFVGQNKPFQTAKIRTDYKGLLTMQQTFEGRYAKRAA